MYGHDGQDYPMGKVTTHIVSRYQKEYTYVHPAEGGIYIDILCFQEIVFCGTEKECTAIVAKDMPKHRTKPEAYKQLGDDETVSNMSPEGYIPVGWNDRVTELLLMEPANKPGYWDNSKEPYVYE